MFPEERGFNRSLEEVVHFDNSHKDGSNLPKDRVIKGKALYRSGDSFFVGVDGISFMTNFRD